MAGKDGKKMAFALAKLPAASRDKTNLDGVSALIAVDGPRGSCFSWLLKDMILPSLYWHATLTGSEWMAKPYCTGAERGVR